MIRKEHSNKSPTSRLLSDSQRLSSTLTSFVSPRDSIRVMALTLQLQQARIFEESSTQTRHLAWLQNGQIVASVGEESSRCVTLISSLQKNGEVRIALKIELAHFTRSSAWCQEVTKRTVSSSQRRERKAPIQPVIRPCFSQSLIQKPIAIYGPEKIAVAIQPRQR